MAAAKSNNRLVYFLVFLVIVVPVITGILVWQLLPGCDDVDDSNGNEMSGGKTGNEQTTVSPGKTTTKEPDTFEDGPWKTLRLPIDKYYPVHYELTLFPDFYGNEDTFYGNVSIEIELMQNTNIIMVHVLYLDIVSTTISTDTGEDIEISRTFEYEPNQFWVVETKKPLRAGFKVYLNIQFSGSLTKSLVGFYKSSYKNTDTNQYR